ncbi:MAG TPA: hypothetical protein VGR76_02270, partial [Candidatus Angelobacter sp.]|nr:hypothetical protein [Candidatus Angelobacter sp.]
AMLDSSTGTIMDAVARNRLANPFFCAYSWEDWKKIVTHPEFRNYHMLANNWRILLEFRHCNSDFQRFLSFWQALPQGRRDLFESLRARGAIT